MWELSTVWSWPGTLASYITPRWSPVRLLRWSGMMTVSIVDEVVWRVVTAFESVALVSMLCFFFLFCGCTIWSQLSPLRSQTSFPILIFAIALNFMHFKIFCSGKIGLWYWKSRNAVTELGWNFGCCCCCVLFWEL